MTNNTQASPIKIEIEKGLTSSAPHSFMNKDKKVSWLVLRIDKDEKVPRYVYT